MLNCTDYRSRVKTNVNFSLIFPSNIFASTSQITMKIKMINAGKVHNY